MANIAAFRALRYAPAKVALPHVVTQPYDKITPPMQQRYYEASAYNLVRIILGKPEPGDDERQNVYSRAADCLRDWRRRGVLVRDSEQSIYQYSQRFQAPGSDTVQERAGFIALGRLEDYDQAVVFRHEQTLSRPKADRLNLLRATRAHFGQIFMLYNDPRQEINSALQGAATSPPEIELQDEYGVTHRVWRHSNSALIAFVSKAMKNKKLLIADGHHRYETALTYKKERRANGSSGAGDQPFDHVMMTFVNMDAPGLVILPTHRVLFGLKDFDTAAFLEKAGESFEVQALDGERSAAEILQILRTRGNATAIAAITKSGAVLLRHKESESAPASKQSDLVLTHLHKGVLEGVLGLTPESIRNQENLRYIRDAGEAMAQVGSEADIAFLVNPVSVKQVSEIAFAGDVMPQKSTDFYPKLLSGLTIYALDQD